MRVSAGQQERWWGCCAWLHVPAPCPQVLPQSVWCSKWSTFFGALSDPMVLQVIRCSKWSTFRRSKWSLNRFALEICIFYFPATGTGNRHRQLAAQANATGNTSRQRPPATGTGRRHWQSLQFGFVAGRVGLRSIKFSFSIGFLRVCFSFAQEFWLSLGFVFGGFQGWFRVVGLVQALGTVSLGLAFFAILFGIRFGFAFGLVLGCFRICSLVYDLFGVGLGLL